ncbi:hypothetical protein [Paraburkholderia bannensis]|uniref:hypothetical protein n=1 Tax=Paraburkholderia bannensis TaxID=765414 RepID=UPI002AB76BC5|nr:hypothetical protein [Paraburkholderia bannensis]
MMESMGVQENVEFMRTELTRIMDDFCRKVSPLQYGAKHRLNVCETESVNLIVALEFFKKIDGDDVSIVAYCKVINGKFNLESSVTINMAEYDYNDINSPLNVPSLDVDGPYLEGGGVPLQDQTGEYKKWLDGFSEFLSKNLNIICSSIKNLPG